MVLRVVAAGEQLPVNLSPLSCELVMFSPVDNGFAPLGLISKFNAPVGQPNEIRVYPTQMTGTSDECH